MRGFAKADHPSSYVVYHDATTGGLGEPCTCQEALAKLSPLLANPKTMENMYKANCGMAKLMNQELRSLSLDNASSVVANRNIMTQGLSAAVVADQWIPVARAVMIAISVWVIPFIALFFPTPFFGAALSLFAGMQLWIMCWGISDAIIYSLTFDYAANAFEALRQSQFGYNAILLLPDATARALYLFGSARLIGLSIATVLSAYLCGHALVAIGSAFSSTMQGGAAAGVPMQTFEGMNQALSSQTMDPGTWKNFDNRA